jgi:hypothetical protein
MKPYFTVFMLTVALYLSGTSESKTVGETSRKPLGPTTTVYTGTTPCGDVPRSLNKISSEAKCDIILWELTLYRNSGDDMPTVFSLTSESRHYINNRDYKSGGRNTNISGKWSIRKGTKSDPNAIVYVLNPDNPGSSVSFLRVDENLLHLLTNDKSLMIGNAGWSYTLCRRENNK